ncbi:universal stress protein (plasmid) [Caballeronia sp. NK8]|nr:universal stress protein [Caballeronia sp. NK8]BCQ30070.1 universal stress protein [Caballeronia sp. NK8]
MLCVDSTDDWTEAAALTVSLADVDTKVRIVGLLKNGRAMIPHAPLAFFNAIAAHVRLQRGVEASIDRARGFLQSAGIDVNTFVADLFESGGDAAHALTRAAQTWRADLMMLAARRHMGILQWTERTTRDAADMAHCSMQVLPAPPARFETARPCRLLCAVDGSPVSLASLRAGLKIAGPGAQVQAIYVIDRSARATDAASTTSLQEAFFEEGQSALAKARTVFSETWCAQDFAFDAALVRTDETGDDVAHAIVHGAARWNADAILMGKERSRAGYSGLCPDAWPN